MPWKQLEHIYIYIYLLSRAFCVFIDRSYLCRYMKCGYAVGYAYSFKHAHYICISNEIIDFYFYWVYVYVVARLNQPAQLIHLSLHYFQFTHCLYHFLCTSLNKCTSHLFPSASIFWHKASVRGTLWEWNSNVIDCYLVWYHREFFGHYLELI